MPDAHGTPLHLGFAIERAGAFGMLMAFNLPHRLPGTGTFATILSFLVCLPISLPPRYEPREKTYILKKFKGGSS